MHFPASANVLVLAIQMDLGFNKTEAHMSDPAMHNADVRPDFWRHPVEQ
jgi:nuclear polyadenylated RNA-binding protein 3